MSISIFCSQCGAHIHAPEKAARRKVHCPKCGAFIRVPAPKNDLRPPSAARSNLEDEAREETDSHGVLRTESQLTAVQREAVREVDAPVEVNTFDVEPPWQENQRSKSAVIVMVSAAAMIVIGLIAYMSR
jgi:DNA-directed RNA polymerase subunit M/transcription elongation factor TFIIS